MSRSDSTDPTMDDLIIRPLVDGAESHAAALLMSNSEPWRTLGRDFETCRRVLDDSTRERYAAIDRGRFAGFIILNMRGAFTGYIQTVCVDPSLRGAGLGSALIRFAEERIFEESPNVFMCVSSFNTAARRLYERLGYEVVGELNDYLVRGHSEILLRKSLGPLGEFMRKVR